MKVCNADLGRREFAKLTTSRIYPAETKSMAQLTTEQAAQMLGISPSTLCDWRCRKFGPAYTKTGRLIRYPDYEVERWIRENTIHSSATEGFTRVELIRTNELRQRIFRPERFGGRSKKR
jgi:predicted DNA-binding transcriptional regulator AlpA